MVFTVVVLVDTQTKWKDLVWLHHLKDMVVMANWDMKEAIFQVNHGDEVTHMEEWHKNRQVLVLEFWRNDGCVEEPHINDKATLPVLLGHHPEG